MCSKYLIFYLSFFIGGGGCGCGVPVQSTISVTAYVIADHNIKFRVASVVMGIEDTYTALLYELAFTATRSVSGYCCKFKQP